MRKVAVIGGGPAGCYAAYRLQQQGHKVILFEAQTQVGGRTQSYRHDGYTLDSGAAFITNFYPITHGLIKTLNLSEQVKAIDRSTALCQAGQVAQLKLGSARSFLQYPFLSATDKAKIAVHIAKLMARRFQLSLTDLKKLARNDDATIAEYIRGQLNEQIYQNVVRPGIEPFWYFNCEVASRALYTALSAHAADAKFFVFTQGIDRLCHQLVASCELALGHSVQAITESDAGLRITTTSGVHQGLGDDGVSSDVFDEVVIATTASVALNISADLSPDFISEQQRDYLRTQEYVANTHCVFKTSAFKRRFHAFSLFPCGPGVHPVAAISFNSEKCTQLREHQVELISLYLGHEFSQHLAMQFNKAGQQMPSTRVFERSAFNVSKEDQNGLMATAYEQAQRLYDALPPLSEVSPFYCVQRQEAIPVPTVGRFRAALAFQDQQRRRKTSKRQQAKASRVVFVGDYLSSATVEGALASVDAVLF